MQEASWSAVLSLTSAIPGLLLNRYTSILRTGRNATSRERYTYTKSLARYSSHSIARYSTLKSSEGGILRSEITLN